MQTRLSGNLMGLYYGIAGAALIAASMLLPTHSLLWLRVLMLWVAVSLLVVCAAYARNYGALFRKKTDGRIPFWAKVLFLPFLFGVHLYNHISRARDKGPAIEKITNNLYLGRKLTPLDMDLIKLHNITAILDLTAEFDALEVSRYGHQIDYLSIPVLDHQIPTVQQLRNAVNWIHKQRRGGNAVLVHCALGKGRSATVALAYLALLDKRQRLTEVLFEVQSKSARCRPNSRQMSWLKNIVHEQQISLTRNAILIVNPVSGGGKWKQYESTIREHLEPFFELQVMQTLPDKSAANLAEQALAQQPDCIIAAGGDGTLSEVASRMVNREVPLGIIPLGTANALSQVLLGNEGLSRPVDACCEAINAGHCHKVDSIKCNGHLSLLLVGIGFESQMIDFADRDAKNQSGVAAYLKGFAHALSKNKQFSATLTFEDGKQKHIDTTSLIIANAAPPSSVLAQGGGRPVIDDGLMDITWLTPAQTPLENVVNILDLWVSDPSTDSERFSHYQCQSVKIDTDPQLPFVVDGELLESTPLEITCLPKSLNLIVPENFTS